ncbi:helix-turn-helix domain-containing protein [Polaribacter vadi]|uniref:helix-turn-helix domain-containing protein n=1 Tax=Polaribacter TaxID=52959 RepID=UPI001C08EE7C|nr:MULTISPECIES: helix-turn-helix domain-containing protein [Polaribacter]MBU3010081.1 helix-turn-helix domain-containing protein [Polaribacter vadi]MDO6739888.1 helix-turn-helix domain-containing protein [Polaribacter sp. 1_MG-2023]
MSTLLEHREKLNLTQEELATKSGVSVRTIQRIESGVKPKGYTLESISKALGINKEDLLKENKESEKINKQLTKYINLSSIILLIVPFGSIIMPLIFMRWKKEINTVTKQIVSIQILWTLSFLIVTLLVAFLSKWFSLSKEIIPLVMLTLIIINLYIIIRNTAEIEKNNKLHIRLNFSIL